MVLRGGAERVGSVLRQCGGGGREREGGCQLRSPAVVLIVEEAPFAVIALVLSMGSTRARLYGRHKVY